MSFTLCGVDVTIVVPDDASDLTRFLLSRPDCSGSLLELREPVTA